MVTLFIRKKNFEKYIVPSLNTDKGASIASMGRVRQMIATRQGETVYQS